MTKEKIASLNNYLSSLLTRLNEPIPAKHQHRPEAFRQFLRNEISTVRATLEASKLESLGGGK